MNLLSLIMLFLLRSRLMLIILDCLDELFICYKNGNIWLKDDTDFYAENY